MERNNGLKNILSEHKKEIIMTALLLSIALISLLIITLTRNEGAYAEVYVSDERVAKYSLGENGEYPILDGKLVLAIEDKAAYVKCSDCPDKVCVKTGKLRMSGQRAVCLPNKVTVIIRGEKTGDEPDLVS